MIRCVDTVDSSNHPPAGLWGRSGFFHRIVQIIAVSLAYFLAGKASLLLAIPPGYATAVWPAAGFALASVLLFGYRVLPGVVIGSFLVNIGISFDSSSREAILLSMLLATSIGIGAALQAARTSAPGLVVTDWEGDTAPKLNGKALALKPYEQSRSLAIHRAYIAGKK